MRRLNLYWLLLVLLLAGCSSDGSNVTVQTNGMRFVQERVEVKAGEAVTLHVVNRDGYAHGFDLDEFDIHMPLAADETREIVITPEHPGVYTFYCGAPGHKAAGMTGTLVVTP